MGLLEKLKNTFFEEEYVEVEEKEEKPKEKKVAKKIEEPKIEKEVKPVIIEEEIEDEEEIEEIEEPSTYSDRDFVNKGSKLTYFDDEDFEATTNIPVVKKEEPKRVYGEDSATLYNSIKLDDLNKYSNTSHRAYGAVENKFQPTPIISPIYGVLDKNYRKEEVIDRKDKPSSYVSRKNVDLDSVRRKAYGETPVEPLEEEKQPEDKVIFDNTVEETKPIVDEVTIADAEEYFNDLGLEYNIDYKDRHYENAVGRRSDLHKEDSDDTYDEVIINDDNNITMDDLMNVKTEEENEEEAHLEDNLFDLVDSIYEDGE